jgi:hypothetical protein
VQVVEHDHQRGSLGGVAQDRADRFEQSLPIAFGPLGARCVDVELRHESDKLVDLDREPAAQGGQIDCAEILPQHLPERLIRRERVFVAPAVEHRAAVAMRLSGEVRGKVRLANSGLAAE